MKDNPIEELLPSWFEGTLTVEEKEKVDQWKNASAENRQILADFHRMWEGMEQLKRMKKYDSKKAIQNLNAKIQKKRRFNGWKMFRRMAAILILPLVITTLYLSIHKIQLKDQTVAWHTLEIPAGMRSEFILPDSTKVYLNSKTTLSYPIEFSNTIREVKLSGEAYFVVAENKKVPFIVNTGRINIKVTGTEFLATNYANEKLTEILLFKGGIRLFQNDYDTEKKYITDLEPGEMAFCRNDNNKLVIKKVNPEKYASWKNGILMFRDDPMSEVVKRLNRWYNVNIKLEGPELKDWNYTATFEDESLMQVLELLKISAPIDYTIKEREIKTNKTFSKMEIIIRQKKN